MVFILQEQIITQQWRNSSMMLLQATIDRILLILKVLAKEVCDLLILLIKIIKSIISIRGGSLYFDLYGRNCTVITIQTQDNTCILIG